jgi:hypothetical protein
MSAMNGSSKKYQTRLKVFGSAHFNYVTTVPQRLWLYLQILDKDERMC